jgi:ABC-2 type transport system ATP-binding protein
MTTALAAFEVVALTKRYRGKPTPANDRISLRVERGEFLGIFGPNGAGKTTLVKQLTGLLRPTSGSILLAGEDVVAYPQIVASRVGYYGQRVAALRHHTAREVLVFTGCLRGLSHRQATTEAAGMLDRFDMGEHADRRLSRQSGGEQRLAVLLATFIGSPEIVVLDEPTNELDPVRRRAFWQFLSDYTQQRGATVLLTTHNLAEAETVIETVAMIAHGRLVAKDTLGTMKRHLGDRVRLELRLRADTEKTISSALTAVAGSRHIQGQRWEVTATRAQADRLLTHIIDVVGIDRLDDFRLITPTLEDLYLRYASTKETDDAQLD